MAMNSAYAAYQNTSVNTASSERLLIMLYDGLIRCLETAKNDIQSKDFIRAGKQLNKAQSIVLEGLLGPLDMSFEVSHSLASLYDYHYRRLIEANVKKDVAIIDETLAFARDFRDMWMQAMAKAVSERDASNHGQSGWSGAAI